jgi:hypothetical protein
MEEMNLKEMTNEELVKIFIRNCKDINFVIEHSSVWHELLCRLEEGQKTMEILRLQLAACGVAAGMNTETSKKYRISKDSPYYTASYQDVCNAVDREIKLRAKVEEGQKAIED